MARRLSDCDADAEDIVQEALARAWRHAETCQSPDPLPWVLAITRREALRQRAARRDNPTPDPELLTRSLGVDPLDEIHGRLDLRILMDSLEAIDQQLLRLRYEEDLTQQAVAKELGIPEGTTKVRLHRLRARLRSTLAEE